MTSFKLLVLVQDPAVYTSIDDAFAAVLRSMSITTKQCKVRTLSTSFRKNTKPMIQKRMCMK